MFSRNLLPILVAVLFSPSWLLGFSTGAADGNSGAPGERNCSRCHSHGGDPPVYDSAAITVHFPDAILLYEPGGPPVSLRLTVEDEEAAFFGFQLTVRDQANATAGLLAAADATTWVSEGQGLQYLNHESPKETGEFEFQWTPPAEDAGPVFFYVAANAANGNDVPSGDRIHLRTFVVRVAGALEKPIILPSGVVHGTTLLPDEGLAPNGFGSIFGADLTLTTGHWGDHFIDGVAPTELGGARVLVNGRPAYLSFVGRGEDSGGQFDQINFVSPEDNSLGPVTVVVETPEGASDPVMVNLAERAPGLFPFEPRQRRYAAAVLNDGSAYIAPEDLFGDAPLPLPVRRARPGDLVQLYGTGFGPTDPPVPIGQIPPVGVISRIQEELNITAGGLPADVRYAGLSAFVGVYQFVIRIPEGPQVDANGDAELIVEIGGLQTSPVFLAIEQQ